MDFDAIADFNKFEKDLKFLMAELKVLVITFCWGFNCFKHNACKIMHVASASYFFFLMRVIGIKLPDSMGG